MPRLFGPLTAPDHRGRDVPLRGFAPLPVTALREQDTDDTDPGLSNLRLRVRAVVRKAPPIFAFVVLLVLTLPVPIFNAPLASRTGMIGPLLLVAPAFAGFVLLITLADRRHSARQADVITNAFLLDGRCPGCGYTVHAASTDPDGLVICPECSAAWRRAAIDVPPRPRPPLIAGGALSRMLDKHAQSRGLGVVLDAKGRALRLADPSLHRTDPVHLAQLGDCRVASLRAHIRRESFQSGRLLIALCALLGLTLLVRPLVTSPPTPSAPLADPVVRLPVTVLLLGVFGFWLVRGMARGALLPDRQRAAIQLEHAICPACLGDLTTTAAPSAGVIACPTCGATWQPTARDVA